MSVSIVAAPERQDGLAFVLLHFEVVDLAKVFGGRPDQAATVPTLSLESTE